jgi:hypothetical protein
MLFNITIIKKMVSFSFLETLFFLILGTTFVLILLLIYHFKKRITDIEFRSDKLFAMVKCLAEEIQSKPNNSGGINNDIYPLNMSTENITAFKNVNLNVKLPNEIDVYDIIEDDEIDDDEEVEEEVDEQEESDEESEEESNEDSEEDEGDEEDDDVHKDLLSNGDILVKKIEQPQLSDSDSFKKMTVNELKNIAIQRNIEVSNKMKKNELIALLSK